MAPGVKTGRFLFMPGMKPTRRTLLYTAPFLSLPALAAQSRSPKVAVTGLEIFRVRVNRRGDWVIARVQTSAGVTGIGDASQSGSDDQMIQLMRQFFSAIKGNKSLDSHSLQQYT